MVEMAAEDLELLGFEHVSPHESTYNQSKAVEAEANFQQSSDLLESTK